MEALLYIHPHLRQNMEGGDTLEKFFSLRYMSSNFYHIPNLVIQGQRYKTVEHWYQTQKAVFAGEYELASEIFWTPTPALTKKVPFQSLCLLRVGRDDPLQLSSQLEGKLDLAAWREVQIFVMARGLEVKGGWVVGDPAGYECSFRFIKVWQPTPKGWEPGLFVILGYDTSGKVTITHPSGRSLYVHLSHLQPSTPIPKPLFPFYQSPNPPHHQ